MLDVAQDGSTTKFLPSSSQLPEPKEKGEHSDASAHFVHKKGLHQCTGPFPPKPLGFSEEKGLWNLTANTLTQRRICSYGEGSVSFVKSPHC